MCGRMRHGLLEFSMPQPACYLRYLQDKDPRVLQEALMALARAPGDVPTAALLPLLSNETAAVRGAAALALARHQPEVALKVIPVQMRLEMKASLKLGEDYERRGKPQLTQPEIDEITGRFRSQMKIAAGALHVEGAGRDRGAGRVCVRAGRRASHSLTASWQDSSSGTGLERTRNLPSKHWVRAIPRWRTVPSGCWCRQGQPFCRT